MRKRLLVEVADPMTTKSKTESDEAVRATAHDKEAEPAQEKLRGGKGEPKLAKLCAAKVGSGCVKSVAGKKAPKLFLMIANNNRSGRL